MHVNRSLQESIVMADFQQFNEGIKRASLIPVQHVPHNHKDVTPPKDKFFLIHLFIFFVGFGGVVPHAYFFTAMTYVYWFF
ncbi:hypothetical protein JTB14_016837 [Gonioctena quinquepunctata]|nr:hypothetical protein JTB14_016837 [Gonioctena quinquepunctata]